MATVTFPAGTRGFIMDACLSAIIGALWWFMASMIWVNLTGGSALDPVPLLGWTAALPAYLYISGRLFREAPP